MATLYPLKFTPVLKEKIWGGNKIETILKHTISPLKNCGESWEVSAVPTRPSIISNGPWEGQPLPSLIQAYPEAILGKSVAARFNAQLPLLAKFIDAKRDLSIQVPPNDSMAQRLHGKMGKSEMWYIIHAETGAHLYAGF